MNIVPSSYYAAVPQQSGTNYAYGGPGNDTINQYITNNYFGGNTRYGGGHFGAYFPQFNLGHFFSNFGSLFGGFFGAHQPVHQKYCYPTTSYHYPTTYSNATASAYAGAYSGGAYANASAYANAGGWGWPGATASASATARAGAGGYYWG